MYHSLSIPLAVFDSIVNIVCPQLNINYQIIVKLHGDLIRASRGIKF